MIANLKINKFIGIKELEVQNKSGKNLVIFGPNGSGKSSIIDAIKFLQEKESEISKSGRDRQKLLCWHGCDLTEVSAEAKIASNKSVSRVGGQKTVFSDSDARSYFQNIQILRKDNLLEFLNVNDADRYRMFLSLMNLGGITRRIESFQGAVTECRGLARSIEQKRSGLHKSVEFARLEGKSFAEIESKYLARVAVEFRGFAVGDNLESLEPKYASLTDTNVQERIARLNGEKQTLQKYLSKEDIEGFKALKDAIKRLEAEHALLKTSDLLPLIRAAIQSFEEHMFENCPVCLNEKGFAQNVILDELKRRRNELEKITIRENEVFELTKKLNVRRKIQDSVFIDGNCLNGTYKNELEKLQAWADKLHSSTIPGSEELNIEFLESFRSAETTKLDEIQLELSSISSNIDILNAINSTLLRNKESWLKAEHLNVDVSRKLSKLSKCLGDLIAARDQVIDAVFKEIQELTLEIYCRLNYGVNEFDGVDLHKLRTSSLQLEIDFFDQKKVDPKSALSTGHLELFALAMFLSTIRKFCVAGTLIVLEDVITSNDNNHKQNIIKVILNDFKDYKIILTTHLRSFHSSIVDAISALGREGDWLSYELEEWDKDVGATISKLNNSPVSQNARLEFLNENLTTENYLKVGGVLRMLAEAFIKRLADKKKVKVRYNKNHLFTAGDFMTSDELKKAVRSDLSSEVSDTDLDNLLIDFFGQTSILNFLSHENELTDDVPLSEVATFVSALEKLLEFEGKGLFTRSP